MKKKYTFMAVAISIALLNCSHEKAKTTNESNVVETEKTTDTETDVLLIPVDGYFATIKPLEVKGVLIKSQSEFEANFNPAKTMTNKIPQIDFTTNNAGAIMMPASEYDTKIVINKSYVKGNILYIHYSADKAEEKRTYSTMPQLLFTFSSSLAVDSIQIDK